jgi:hypothetical protein
VVDAGRAGRGQHPIETQPVGLVDPVTAPAGLGAFGDLPGQVDDGVGPLHQFGQRCDHRDVGSGQVQADHLGRARTDVAGGGTAERGGEVDADDPDPVGSEQVGDPGPYGAGYPGDDYGPHRSTMP